MSLQAFTSSANGTAPVSGKSMVSSGGGNWPAWRGDGKELCYTSPEGEMMAVEIITNPTSSRAGIPHPLFQMPPTAFGWDLSADGNRFLVAVPLSENSPAPFTVVLNWQVPLKR